jgi:ribosomal-protein-serine acetyltransferase
MGIWYKGELVGFICLSRLHDSVTAAEFGYWITAEQEGKGIVTRCVSALMDFAIDKMKIERFVIGCAANNQRSRAVAERLGYHLHVTQPNGEVVAEFVYDRAIYGIRSSAWRERNKENLSSMDHYESVFTVAGVRSLMAARVLKR